MGTIGGVARNGKGQGREMAQIDRSKVRWRTIITLGQGSEYLSFYFCKKLNGVLLRCPKCGQMASILYYGQYGFYVKCRSCHEQTFLREWSAARDLLGEVLPASDVKDVMRMPLRMRKSL